MQKIQNDTGESLRLFRVDPMAGLGNGFQLCLGKMGAQQLQFMLVQITAEPAAHKQHGAGIGEFGGQGAGDFRVAADQYV